MRYATARDDVTVEYYCMYDKENKTIINSMYGYMKAGTRYSCRGEEREQMHSGDENGRMSGLRSGGKGGCGRKEVVKGKFLSHRMALSQ